MAMEIRDAKTLKRMAATLLLRGDLIVMRPCQFRQYVYGRGASPRVTAVVPTVTVISGRLRRLLCSPPHSDLPPPFSIAKRSRGQSAKVRRTSAPVWLSKKSPPELRILLILRAVFCVDWRRASLE